MNIDMITHMFNHNQVESYILGMLHARDPEKRMNLLALYIYIYVIRMIRKRYLIDYDIPPFHILYNKEMSELLFSSPWFVQICGLIAS